jgi:hypothetical protein
MAIQRKHALGVLIGLTAILLGCPVGYYQNQQRDVDRTPTVDTGAGASIIYPGQTAPGLPGGSQPGTGTATPAQSGTQEPPQQQYGAARAAQPPPEYSQPYGSSAPAGGGVTMIGGSKVDEKRHQKVQSQPVIFKYLALPVAVVAAPFKYAADKVRGEPEPGPAIPEANQQAPATPPGPPPVDYETASLRDLERELAQRTPSTPAPTPTATPIPQQPSRPAPAPSGASSIADELAALRARGPESNAPTTRSSPTPHVSAGEPVTAPRTQRAPDASLAAASGVIDRDGDGRTDHWIFRENGEIARESFDENFDGVPDRTLHYDLASHRVARIDEDTNQDGHIDSWTALRDGVVVRRRIDTDDDGDVDSWSFYRDGNVTRLERDSSGDGFRDHVAHYRDGHMEREEEDGDGDGRLDLIKYYDERERIVRVEEDSDGDGNMDVISHYEEGRLARRELLEASVLDGPKPEGPEQN